MRHNYNLTLVNHLGKKVAFALDTDGSYVPSVGDQIVVGYDTKIRNVNKRDVFATVQSNIVYLILGIKYVTTVLDFTREFDTEEGYKAFGVSLLDNGWESVDNSFEEEYMQDCECEMCGK